MEDLEKARGTIKNPVWRDIYCALLKCRINYVTLYHEEFLTIPVNKEPDLTANFIGLQQDWSNGIMLPKYSITTAISVPLITSEPPKSR